MNYLQRVALVGLVALGACGDDAGTNTVKGTPALPVSLFTAVTGTSITTADDGMPMLSCDLDLTATTPATGQGSATWTGAVLRIYSGVDRTAPLDSVLLSGSDLLVTLGDGSIGPGAALTAHWRLGSRLPFEGEFIFRYRSAGRDTATSPTRFGCGPLPAIGAAAPGVSAVTVGNPAAEPEVGTELGVTGTVSAPAGAWFARVRLSGAFAAEATVPLSPGATGAIPFAISFPIPADALLGQPVQAQISLTDAAGRPVTVDYSGLPVVDHTAPVFGGVQFLGGGLDVHAAAGETVGVQFGGTDAGRITHLIYNLGAPFGVTDSIPVGVSAGIPSNPGWSGSATATFWLRDAGGNRSTPLSGTLRFYPRITRPVGVTTVVGQVQSIAAVSGALYLATRDGVVRVSAATLQKRVVYPGFVDAIDVSQDERWLWSTVYHTSGGVTLVDLASPTSEARFITMPDSRTMAVSVAANGKAFVSDQGYAGSRLWEVSTNGQMSVRGASALVPHPSGVRTLNAGRLFFAGTGALCGKIYVTATDQFGACRQAESFAPASISTTGLVAFGVRLQNTDGTFRDLKGGYSTGSHSAFSSDASYLYLAGRDGVDVMRISDGQIVARIDVPALTAAGSSGITGLRLVEDHRLALVAQSGDETRVYLIELP
jgi:hypothetical protein